LDIPLTRNDGIVLFPHFMPQIISCWFDKKPLWRKPSRFNVSNVLLVFPLARIAYWQAVIKEGERLADEFLDAVATDKIREGSWESRLAQHASELRAPASGFARK
jgi:hypothetical protein